jgi:hypothetical protein
MTDMTLPDRNTAWNALHDPQTSAAELAEIAGAHSEFAGAIALHPNAYPALVDWARGQAMPQGAPAPQAAPAQAWSAAGAAPAGAARAGSGVASRRRLWIVALSVYTVGPLVIRLLTAAILRTPIQSADALFVPYVLAVALLVEVPVIVVVIIAGIAAHPARRALVVVLGALAVIIGLGVMVVSLGLFGGASAIISPSVGIATMAATMSCLFCCWGLAMPLRPVAFAMLPVTVGFCYVLDYPIWSALWAFFVAQAQPVDYMATALYTSLSIDGIALVVIPLIVIAALALSRRSERTAATASAGWGAGS